VIFSTASKSALRKVNKPELQREEAAEPLFNSSQSAAAGCPEGKVTPDVKRNFQSWFLETLSPFLFVLIYVSGARMVKWNAMFERGEVGKLGWRGGRHGESVRLIGGDEIEVIYGGEAFDLRLLWI